MPLSLLPSVIDLATDWWDDINESQRWQDGIFYALCASYALVSSVALVLLSLSLSTYAHICICICTYVCTHFSLVDFCDF